MASSDSDVFARLRNGYVVLDEEEKAQLMQCVVRRRFTENTFEDWVSASSLGDVVSREEIVGRATAEVRGALDAAIIREEHGALLASAIGCFLRESGEELLREMAQTYVRVVESPSVEDLKRRAREENFFPSLTTQPKGDLVAAAMDASVLDGVLSEVLALASARKADSSSKTEPRELREDVSTDVESERVGSTGKNVSIREQWEEFHRTYRNFELKLDVLRTLGNSEPAGLSQDLGSLIEMGTSLKQRLSLLGIDQWESPQDLESKMSQSEGSGRWEKGLAEFLSGYEVNHPLRRQRQAFVALRDRAIGELCTLQEASGETAHPPGPIHVPAEWWEWATRLDGAGFELLEEWCGSQGLAALIDLVASQWSLDS